MYYPTHRTEWNVQLWVPGNPNHNSAAEAQAWPANAVEVPAGDGNCYGSRSIADPDIHFPALDFDFPVSMGSANGEGPTLVLRPPTQPALVNNLDGVLFATNFIDMPVRVDVAQRLVYIYLRPDISVILLGSKTPFHHHAYIDTPMTWNDYQTLLIALRDNGLLQAGFADSSLLRQCSMLRKPSFMMTAANPAPQVWLTPEQQAAMAMAALDTPANHNQADTPDWI